MACRAASPSGLSFANSSAKAFSMLSQSLADLQSQSKETYFYSDCRAKSSQWKRSARTNLGFAVDWDGCSDANDGMAKELPAGT